MAKEFKAKWEMVKAVLEESKKPMDYREIAQRIGEMFPDYRDKRLNGKAPSEFADIYKHDISDINGYESHEIYFNDETPRKFYLKNSIEDENENSTIKEANLYPILEKSLIEADGWNIYAMRIDEKTSSNEKGKGSGDWLHPDYVGIEDSLASDDTNELKSFVEKSSINQFLLHSFEVKNIIDMSNARSSFFQTLANSSWANYAHLVCASITGEAKQEVNSLCKSFGIGLLKLETDGTLEQIIPSQKRDLDISLMKKIANKNKHFKKFLEKTIRCYNNHEISPNDWK